MNNNLKDEARNQMDHLNSKANPDIAKMLQEMAFDDEYSTHSWPMVHTERLLKYDTNPCECEPDSMTVTYEKEPVSVWPRRIIVGIVALVLVLIVAALAGCDRQSTINHDGHLFIKVVTPQGGISMLHHPDCPCKRAERE